MPPHPFASLHQSEQILHTQRQNHHCMCLRLRQINDRIVLQKLRRKLQIMKFHPFRKRDSPVIRKIRCSDMEILQLLFDSHCAENRRRGLYRRILQNGYFRRSRFQKNPGGFHDDRRMNAGNIVAVSPCQKVRLEQKFLSRNASGFPQLPLDKLFQGGSKIFAFIIRTSCVEHRCSAHGSSSFFCVKKTDSL